MLFIVLFNLNHFSLFCAGSGDLSCSNDFILNRIHKRVWGKSDILTASILFIFCHIETSYHKYTHAFFSLFFFEKKKIIKNKISHMFCNPYIVFNTFTRCNIIAPAFRMSCIYNKQHHHKMCMCIGHREAADDGDRLRAAYE